MNSLFLYGSLRHLPLLQLVLNRPLSDLNISDAVLRDHQVFVVRNEAFPMILSKTGGVAEGILVRDLQSEDMRRLAFYESGFDYDLRSLRVDLPDGGRVDAGVFFPEPDRWVPDSPWLLAHWQRDWSEITMLAAQEVMSHFGRVDAAKVAASLPSIRTRAWSRLQARARRAGSVRDIDEDVVLHRREASYLGYFALDEIQVQHRLNDGTMSPVLNRSGLMQGGAVVLLPYDLERDTVLLVEQFRPPVFMNDDPDPWMWEPVAGMIDPGEAPEQTAHREAREEAQIELKGLEFAGGAYSSSGSSTEYVHLYVGLADLTHTTNNGGLATEGEDIRTQILPFDDFMAAVDAHQFKDLPLLSLAHWLARHRDRLRA